MSIGDSKQPKAIEKLKEEPVVDIPNVEQPDGEEEISAEKRKQAERIVLGTLEIEAENLDDFDGKLNQAAKSLPKYQSIEKKLEGVERQNLPHELFKVLKQDLDEEPVDSSTPKDGVLVKSIKQGHLECAGRTLIASTFLQEHNINHAVVSAPGHALIIIEQSPDTLVYFDANNNLFFTFPKSALEGYEGTEKIAECQLKEYTPRETDSVDGVNTVFSHFVSMPAREGVGRQYLGNVAAALNGNKEFETSGIAKDEEAEKAIHQIEEQIYGENNVLESYGSRVEALIESQNMQAADDKKVLDEILLTNPTRDEFIAFFLEILEGNIGRRFSYIKNATIKQKGLFANNAWSFLQKKET